MKEPIRVLQIIGIVAGGGVEAVIMNYYEHIDRTKVQFDFIVHNDNKIDITQKVEAMGGKVYKVTPYYKNPIAFMWDIYKVIKRHHYRIVHSNMNTLSAFSLLRHGRLELLCVFFITIVLHLRGKPSGTS